MAFYPFVSESPQSIIVQLVPPHNHKLSALVTWRAIGDNPVSRCPSEWHRRRIWYSHPGWSIALILELGLRHGFWTALSAGAGAATADLIYATIAALAGTLMVSILAPFSSILRTVSALGLIVLGAWLLYHGRNISEHNRKSRFGTMNCPQTYGLVLGLTLLNPVTVAYFTTLILGMGTDFSKTSASAILFILGVFLASWQSFLATISGIVHRNLTAKVQAVTFAIGNLVIIGLGISILLGLHI